MLSPTKKWSNIHEFIDFSMMLPLHEERDRDEENEEDRQPCRWLQAVLQCHGVVFWTFEEWHGAVQQEKSDTYFEPLMEQHFEGLREQIVDEVFFLPFMNRSFLKAFNTFLSGYILELTPMDTARKGTRGSLKRIAPPQWAREAVFFRDRGKCVICLTDLSGLLSRYPEDQYDHMMPLHLGGTKDVANLQLLCGSCNRAKGGGPATTGTLYERWYA